LPTFVRTFLKSADKNGLAGDYERLMAQRSMDIPQPPERKTGVD